jgi:ketosteroid isomerase-like protein
MTKLESNRATVLLFCECLSRRDFAGMTALVTSDATWWVVGRPDYFALGGLHSMTNVLKVIEGFIGTFDEFSFNVDVSIAEGDRVAIEASSSGRKGTARYGNAYLIRCQLRDGKIQSVREFFDTYEITDFLKQIAANSGDALDQPHNTTKTQD